MTKAAPTCVTAPPANAQESKIARDAHQARAFFALAHGISSMIDRVIERLRTAARRGV
jgi:hypothetical protein